MKILCISLIIIYFIISFSFLIIAEKKYDIKDDEIFKKEKIESFLILLSMFWLPIVILMGLHFSIKKLFKGEEKK